MEPIYIPQLLKAREQAEQIEVNQNIADLETLTPVQGQMQVAHKGSYLQVTAQVETIITLTCDRCLQRYNHRLICSPSELIWLEEPEAMDAQASLEVEVPVDALVETLSPQGYFDPEDWLYQQLCLDLPQRQLCDPNCPGIPTLAQAEPAIDRRWAGLESLRNRLSNPG